MRFLWGPLAMLGAMKCGASVAGSGGSVLFWSLLSGYALVQWLSGADELL